MNEYQIGNRATLGKKESTKLIGQRKTTIGNSRTADDFMERFEKEKEIEKDLELEKAKNNPGRWYRTTNYDLKYMKKLQDQRNRIIKYEHDVKEKPVSIRGAKCFYYTCKGACCNI